MKKRMTFFSMLPVILLSMGMTCVAAQDMKTIYVGEERLRIAFPAGTYISKMQVEEENPYQLVCLDVMMPIMDGYQALKNIRDLEREHNIPEEQMANVIMTTALNEEKNVKKAFELGCTVYCAKPIDMDKLKEMLEKLELI